QAVFVRRAQARADGQLDLAEALGESQLLVVVDHLAVEDQHGIAVHPGVDRLDLVGGQRPGHVDAIHLGGEARADLASDDWHWRCLPVYRRSRVSDCTPSAPRGDLTQKLT